MLLAACEDSYMNQTLERLLSQPAQHRQRIVELLLEDLRHKNAPTKLFEAIACLRDDEIAQQAYQAIFKYRQ